MVIALSDGVTFAAEYPIRKQITYEDLSSSAKKQVACLADNVYFEARGEDDDGKRAVAYTTLNRVKSGDYAHDVCGVVKQKVKGTCQFSWICDGRLKEHKKDKQLYNKCRDVALDAYINYVPERDDITDGATFYHADYVSPNWRKLTYVKTIGRHLFYKI